MPLMVSVFFIGDIVGEAAVDFVAQALPGLLEAYEVDFCVANAENSHQGRGTNETIVKRLYKAGVDVITGGDHSFDKHLIFPYMAKDKRLLRPLNYPKGVPGYGYGVYQCLMKDVKVGVLNLRGQSYFNNPIQDPLRSADWALTELLRETNLVLIDFHAEATAEKIAFAYYVDGRASAVIGTHTHVQTADERILPQGTGFLTDAGCTGPLDSVIGMDVQTAINRMLLQTPHKYEMGTGPTGLRGVVVNLDAETGKCMSLQRVAVNEADAA